jgi:hypothetical protein
MNKDLGNLLMNLISNVSQPQNTTQNTTQNTNQNISDKSVPKLRGTYYKWNDERLNELKKDLQENNNNVEIVRGKEKWRNLTNSAVIFKNYLKKKIILKLFLKKSLTVD